MKNIEPIEKNIIFKFTEDVTQTRFINSSSSGILINSNDGNQTIYPRWGKVIAIGPNVSDIKVDEFILIESGKWTSSFRINGDRFWKTDENMVIGVSDTPGYTY